MSFHPRAAWRALMRLRDDPEDTRAVFEIFEALPSGELRAYRRFRDSENGQRILRERRSLLARLVDRERLATLPRGTLGREYLEFTAREQLTADGLVDASGGSEGYATYGPDVALFASRWRDMHDLEHVLLGYGRDLRGEGALLAFDLAQTWSLGLALIVGLSWLEGDALERRLLRDAWRRGRAAAWIPETDWESWLERPLDGAREALRVGEPPVYEELRASGAPATA